MPTFQELLPALTGATALTVFLLALLYLKHKGMWYTKREYDAQVRRADRAEDRGDRTVLVALEAKGATEEMLKIVREGQPSTNRPGPPPQRGEW